MLKRNRELEREHNDFKQEQIRFEEAKTKFCTYKLEWMENHNELEAARIRKDRAYGDYGYGTEARERYDCP